MKPDNENTDNLVLENNTKNIVDDSSKDNSSKDNKKDDLFNFWEESINAVKNVNDKDLILNNPNNEDKKENSTTEIYNNLNRKVGDVINNKHSNNNSNEFEGMLKSYLKDNNIINDEDINKGTDIKSVLDERFSKEIDNRVNNYIENLPDDVKELNNFVKNGGNLSEYLNSLGLSHNGETNDIDYHNIDLNKESNQERVLRDALSNEGNDDDTVSAIIDGLKEKGKMKDVAEKKLNFIKESISENHKMMIDEQQKANIEYENKLREAKRSVSNYIINRKDINGVDINSNDKLSLPSYLYDRNINLGNGNNISKFQHDLATKVMNNGEALMQFALLMKSMKNNKFDFSIINNSRDNNKKKSSPWSG